MAERVTVGERYARAATTGNLRMREGPCDADVLLAAAYATCGSARKSLGLRLYRAQVAGDRSEVYAVSAGAMSMLTGRLARSPSRPLPAAQRQELVRATLRWWLDQRCAFCDGLGFESIEGAPALSSTECPACGGTGRAPLRRVLPPALAAHGQWLAREFDALCAIAIGDMAVLLRWEIEGV